MQESSYIAALAASALAAAFVATPHASYARTHAPKSAAPAHRVTSGPARSLAQMDLTPHDYLVRPYAPAYPGGDVRTPTAVAYHFAGDGVMSFGLHRGTAASSDPAGVNQSFAAASPTSHTLVGALLTYSLP